MAKKLSFVFYMLITIMLSGLIIGCGGDDDDNINVKNDVDKLYVDDEDDLDKLYKELVGTYDLYRAEITYVDQPKRVFEPPEISGTMTISSKQKITQNLEVLGVSISLKGTFEILSDEKTMVIDNEGIDLISKPTYTWDGKNFTTTLDVGTYVEKDFWRKQ
jgi:hypothetical protein